MQKGCELEESSAHVSRSCQALLSVESVLHPEDGCRERPRGPAVQVHAGVSQECWGGDALQGTAPAHSWSSAGEHVPLHMARLYIAVLFCVPRYIGVWCTRGLHPAMHLVTVNGT